MKVKELVKKLKNLPQDSEIVITAMDDYFFIEDFEVANTKEDEAQEIILNCYINDYKKGGKNV